MFAIGCDEPEKNPLLGRTITCRVCGEDHRVLNGKSQNSDGEWVESGIVQYFLCKGTPYLCGIGGRSAFKGIDLDIKSGEVHAIGKS